MHNNNKNLLNNTLEDFSNDKEYIDEDDYNQEIDNDIEYEENNDDNTINKNKSYLIDYTRLLVNETCINYEDALIFQKIYSNGIIADCDNNTPNILWFLQHNPIYTVGANVENDSADMKLLLKKLSMENYNDYNEDNNSIVKDNIKLTNTDKIFYSDRGGRITYHSPGQRVIYFIAKINGDIISFISQIQKCIVNVLQNLNIDAFVIKEKHGIYVNFNNEIRKIGSIGFKFKKQVCYHGLSINVTNETAMLDDIALCGDLDIKPIAIKDIIKGVELSDIDYLIVNSLSDYVLIDENDIQKMKAEIKK